MLIYHDFQVSSGVSPDWHFRRDIQEEREAAVIRKTLIIDISKDRETKAATLWLQYWNLDIRNKVSQEVFPTSILRSLLVALLVQLFSSTIITNLLYV